MPAERVVPTMSDRYAEFSSLRLETPEPGLLEIVLDGPNLNAVSPEMHRDLARIWDAIDRDDDVRVVIVRGEGKAFSAGGDFSMIEAMTADTAVRTRIMKEAREM